jgi:site-specific DNA recombinase
MKAAIYSRKSKYTGKGESIENQIQLCKEHGIKYLGIKEEDFIIYEDEGFSGGNMKRPQFQKMMKDAIEKKFNMLICYRLDRISRNVSDFSGLIKDLNKYNVDFISLREQFDTTTPMGRAMMYIASVFSQLERETIAERIRDNMIELAKTGRWLGGAVPTGFESEAISIIDNGGKERKMFKLSPIVEEINVINLIYNKYVELKSITKLEKFLIINKINTKNGLDFQRYSLRFILSNPVYAIADKELYKYLLDNGYEIYSNEDEFNGINGLMAYNKTLQNKADNVNRTRGFNEWIISVGKHEGIIHSDIWIGTQKLLDQNKTKAFRKVKSTTSLLSGVLRCANCGSYMRPKAVQRYNSDGEQVFYYMCEMKEKSKKTRCDNSNINGNLLDKSVINQLITLSKENSPLVGEVSNKKELVKLTKDSIVEETFMLNKRSEEIDISIMNIISSIEKGQPDNVLSILYKRMEELSKEKDKISKRIWEMKDVDKVCEFNGFNMDLVVDNLANISKASWELMDVEAKRNMIKSVVDKILWDSEKVDMILFGSKMVENLQMELTELPNLVNLSEMFPQCEDRK